MSISGVGNNNRSNDVSLDNKKDQAIAQQRIDAQNFANAEAQNQEEVRRRLGMQNPQLLLLQLGVQPGNASEAQGKLEALDPASRAVANEVIKQARIAVFGSADVGGSTGIAEESSGNLDTDTGSGQEAANDKQ